MAVIELNGLSKWYGEVIGLNNVTLRIDSGITGLVGPNGAGKSTMMGLAMGQLRPSKGRIRVLGHRPWDAPAVLSRIGYCPEGDPFWPSLTGWQFVMFLARMSGMRGREAARAVDEAIEATGMTENARRAIKGYSKGMRQRIKIAQALVHGPELLILDEPFTGADPVARHDLAQLFRGLAERGVDVLISSHVLHEVESLTKQIVLIDHGRVIAHGKLQSVRETLHDRPLAIRVRLATDRGAEGDSAFRWLAGRLAALDSVSGLKMEPPDTLLVETHTSQRLYATLTDLILEKKLPVVEIAACDESLEAVFGYLTRPDAA